MSCFYEKLAIEECIAEGVLKEFLEKQRAEAKAMSIFEYDREKHMSMERKENYEEGYSEGHAEGHAQGLSSALLMLLESRGEVPESERSKINETTDREVLQQWIKNAAVMTSLEEFFQTM